MRETQKLEFGDRQSLMMVGMHARFRALNEEGEYLHMCGQGFTRDVNLAWRGNGRQFAAINKIHGGKLTEVLVNEGHRARPQIRRDFE